MNTVKKEEQRSNAKERGEASQQLIEGEYDLQSRILLIQQLIPLGLMAVEEMLQQEVLSLVGEKYSRQGNRKRWGSNPGSVFLGSQKLSIRVPRVRDVREKREVELGTYERLQAPQVVNEQVFAQLLNGISTRNYEKAALKIPATFGISKSSVSRKFINTSAQKLKQLQERKLSHHDIIAIFMDGKSFANNELILALGVTLQGEKIVLGLIESSTENYQVCKDFLLQLQERGLKKQHKLLFIIDGAKGLRKAIEKVFGNQALVQRCQWHKRENVVAYLPKSQQELFRKKLQQAYQQPSYSKAKEKLNAIGKELALINQSALHSLEEGLEETLTLHRLGVFPQVGISLKTTNCLESVNSQLERYTSRISYWKNSSQRQRWVATALLEMEPRLRKIRGFRHLPLLRQAMEKEGEKHAVLADVA